MQKYVKHIDLRHSDSRTVELVSDVWVKFGCLNDSFNLKNHEKICFKVDKGFETDGASIPRSLQFLIHPLSWWILLAAIAHDWIWGNSYIYAYVYDENKKKITKELGIVDISYAEGNKIMLEKMLAFCTPNLLTFIKTRSVFYTLELIRLFK